MNISKLCTKLIKILSVCSHKKLIPPEGTYQVKGERETPKKLGVCTLLKAENWNLINWKPIELLRHFYQGRCYIKLNERRLLKFKEVMWIYVLQWQRKLMTLHKTNISIFSKEIIMFQSTSIKVGEHRMKSHGEKTTVGVLKWSCIAQSLKNLPCPNQNSRWYPHFIISELQWISGHSTYFLLWTEKLVRIALACLHCVWRSDALYLYFIWLFSSWEQEGLIHRAVVRSHLNHDILEIWPRARIKWDFARGRDLERCL